MKNGQQYWTYVVGWFVLCPVYLADVESEMLTPLPRGVPDCWLDFNLRLNGVIQWVISLVSPESVGFMAWGVKQLARPKEIRVRREDGEATD